MPMLPWIKPLSAGLDAAAKHRLLLQHPAGKPPAAASDQPGIARSRRASVAAAAKPKRLDAYAEIERELLPSGKPNTAWRRINLKIQNTNSIDGLTRIYQQHRHKTAVWRPIHSAGLLMRLAALHYYRLTLQGQQQQHSRPDGRMAAAAHSLLEQLAPDLADPRVLSALEPARLAQAVVVLSHLQPLPGQQLLDPLIRELMRAAGRKLPRSKPGLLADLAAALARLGWREQELWLALAAAAKESLQAQQAYRSWRQQQEQEQELLPAAAQAAAAAQHWQQLAAADDEDNNFDEFEGWDDLEEFPLGGFLNGSEQLQQQGLADSRSTEYSSWPADEREGFEAEFAAAHVFDDVSAAAQHQHQQQRQQLYPPSFDDTAFSSSSSHSWAAGATSTYAGSEGSALMLRPLPRAPRYSQAQPGQQPPPWLSADYPRLAAAVAAVQLQDPQLMQLLGSEAAVVLPLLSLPELAVLAEAFAAADAAHAELLPALARQLQLQAVQLIGSSASSSRSQGVTAAANLVSAAHALEQLGCAPDSLVAAVQEAVVTVASSSGRSSSSSNGQLPAGELVKLLQLLSRGSIAGRSGSQDRWQQQQSAAASTWACSALASSGLDALSPQQLQDVAAVLVGLQASQAAAHTSSSAAVRSGAAAVAAAAVARAEECGAAVLSEVLWAVTTVGVADMLLAEAAAHAATGSHSSEGWDGKPAEPADDSSVQHQSGALQHDDWHAQSLVQPRRPPRPFSSKHQAQLVWALQQLGRHDLSQRVLAVFAGLE